MINTLFVNKFFSSRDLKARQNAAPNHPTPTGRCHYFYESTKRNKIKDQFSRLRAERIDWIKAALQDPFAELYVGWDGKRNRHDCGRRVTLMVGNYVVVIRISGKQSTQFVTAYVADSPSTLAKIKGNLK